MKYTKDYRKMHIISLFHELQDHSLLCSSLVRGILSSRTEGSGTIQPLNGSTLLFQEFKKKKPVSQNVIYFLQVYLCLLTIAFQHPSSHVWTRLRSATSGVQIAVREKASCAFHKYYPARESLNSDFLRAQVHHQHFIVLGF